MIPLPRMTLVDFLGGATAMAYLVAAVFFLRFWRKTRDGLFIAFAWAFLLLAVNGAFVTLLGAADERTGYFYILRIVGFMLILFSIIGKNLSGRRPG